MASPEPLTTTVLRERLAELDDLGAAGSLLGWDQQTMMPPGGAAARGEVLATIERLHHGRLTDPGLAAALDSVTAEDSEDAALARVVRRDADRARRVPDELVADMARAGSAAQPAWMAAREARDFGLFAPALERNLELRRRLAACFDDAVHPYDALMDAFEPGLTTAQVRDVFGRLHEGLVPLIAAIAAAPAPPALDGPFPVDRQRELSLEVARSFGFDDEHWRLDLAVHPFAESLSPTDVRVTGRFMEDSLSGLFAVMHEVGHGLYEHQIDPALARTTVGTGVSLGIHESQSRLWENLVGRSRPFWSHWYPRLQEVFPEAVGGMGLDDFLRAVNVVRPTFIRVEADEATYALHVILRFELEVALVEGSLAVADLPEAWNAKMKELLGLDVPHDTVGVLQDIHWAYGEFGYFPTYAIGNIVAAQLWQVIRRDLPDLDASVAAGDCTPLRAWLAEHVHRHGRTLLPGELLAQATGSPDLDPEPALAYLRDKYGARYGL